MLLLLVSIAADMVCKEGGMVKKFHLHFIYNYLPKHPVIEGPGSTPDRPRVFKTCDHLVAEMWPFFCHTLSYLVM